MDAELRECPFCGKEAHYRIFGVGNDLLMIECENPFGSCVFMKTCGTNDDAKKRLADKWNQRSADGEIAAFTNAVIDLSKEI
jgi:hypothetical protein